MRVTGLAGRSAAGRQPVPDRLRRWRSSAIGATDSTAASASLTDQPSPSSPARTWSRQHSSPARETGTGRHPLPVGRTDPVLELEHDPLRALCADAGHLAERHQVLVATARRSSSGPCTATIACASLGPTPLAVWSSSKIAALVVVGETEQRQRVLADDHRRGQRRLLAHPQRGEARRACTSPGCRRRRRRRRRSRRKRPTRCPSTNAIIGRPPETAACLCQRRVESAASRNRARCGTSPARARRPHRPATGRSVSPRRRITIAVTWALSARPLPVTAALTSLGVCSATGMPRRAAATTAMPGCLGRAHHRADVVLGEDPLDRDGIGLVLVEPRLQCPLDRDQPGAEVVVGRGAHDVDGHGAQGPAERALDDAETAAGQPGVDAQHAHRQAPVVGARTNMCSTRDNLTCRACSAAERLARVRPVLGVSRHHLVGDVEVAEDVLDVVGVLERLDQPEHLVRAGLVDRRRSCSGRTTPRPTRSRGRRPAVRCARRRGRWVRR